jgi:hypothetical protein
MPIRRVLISPFVMAGSLFFVWSKSLADVAVFTPAKDNTLYESPTGALSNGIGSWFFSGQTNALELRRGIIAFDLSSIPVDALVQDVSLVLFMDQTFVPTERTIALHRVLQDWGEGTTDAGFGEGGGGPSTPGSVTWIHTFFDTSFWVNEAGDFVAAASAQTAVGAEGFPYEWSGPGLIQDVQAWVENPSLNFGWILIGEEVQTGSTKRFRAREFPDPLTVPMLMVTYLPNPVSSPPGDSATWARIKSLYR